MIRESIVTNWLASKKRITITNGVIAAHTNCDSSKSLYLSRNTWYSNWNYTVFHVFINRFPHRLVYQVQLVDGHVPAVDWTWYVALVCCFVRPNPTLRTHAASSHYPDSFLFTIATTTKLRNVVYKKSIFWLTTLQTRREFREAVHIVWHGWHDTRNDWWAHIYISGDYTESVAGNLNRME